MKMLSVFVVPAFAAVCLGAELPAEAPEAVAGKLLAAWKAKDTAGAVKLMYNPQPTKEAELSKSADEYAEVAARTEVVESKISGDFAAVIVNERQPGRKAPNLDPFYMRRTVEGWRVAPDVTQLNLLVGPGTEGEKELKDLQKWFEQRRPELSKELMRPKQ